jgi:hypothetical protein
MKFRYAAATFLLMSTIASSTSAQNLAELKAELSSFSSQIEKVDRTIAEYEGGIIKTLAETRKEALLLSKALIENRILAADGNATLMIQVPAVAPNEEKAQQLLGELAQQQKVVTEATQEAEKAGGLIKALALSRVEAEKLTLSQLQMAYLQAKYGIAFPNFTTNLNTGENDATTNSGSDDAGDNGPPDGKGVSSNTDERDAGSESQWQFVEDFDSFNDKNSSYIYLEPTSTVSGDDPKFIAVKCDAKGGYDILVASNGYIGARDNRVQVRYRFGTNDPTTEKWNESTTGTAAFLPSSYNDFRTNLATGEDFVFEITDYNGSRSSSEFDNNKDEKLEFVMGGCKNK